MDQKELEKMIQEEIRRVENEFTFEKKHLSMSPKEIAKYIDHTLLKAFALTTDIEILCKEAIDNNFFAICVNPTYVSLAKELLQNSNIKIATVIGFPLGANTAETKVFEAKDAIKNGADELDMVINIGRLKAKEYYYVYKEIETIADVSKNKGKLLKVIIETCYLTQEEKIAAVLISKLAQADYVKTSTGFGTHGATAEDVSLMKFVGEDKLKVKASGGIKDYQTALEMIAAGANRIGTSSGVKIVSN